MPRRKMAPVDTGAVILFRPAGYTILLFSPVPCPQIGDNLTMQKKYAPIQNNCCIRQPVAVECWQLKTETTKPGDRRKENTMKYTKIECENTINAVVTSEIAKRMAAHHAARAANVAAYQAAAMRDVPTDSPLYPIASLVSQTITIGRVDGYPQINLPDETKDLLRRAANAGIVSAPAGAWRVGTLWFSSDFSGIGAELPEKSADMRAWEKLTKYASENDVTLPPFAA